MLTSPSPPRWQVGVVEHGLFCGMSTAVIIAGKEGISFKEAPAAPVEMSGAAKILRIRCSKCLERRR